MSTSCRFCRHSNPDGAKFCNECGAQVSLKPCPECEAVNAVAAPQCHQCGHAFDDVAAPATGPSTTVVADDTLSFRDDDAHVPETLAYALVAEGATGTPFARATAPAETTSADAQPDRETDGEDRPRDDRTGAASPDDAVPLHDDIRAFRNSLRQQQARRSYRAAGAAFLVVALVAAGYAYWSNRGSDGASRIESAVKDKSSNPAPSGKAADAAAATSASVAREAAPAESTANAPAASSSETAAGQASGDAGNASSSAAGTGSAASTTSRSATASSKRGPGTTPRRRASSGAANAASADAAATQRLIARDLDRVRSSDSTSKPSLDRDAIETKRLVDRDLAPFRERNSRPPDRAFPEIN